MLQFFQAVARLIQDWIFFGKTKAEQILSFIIMIECFPRNTCPSVCLDEKYRKEGIKNRPKKYVAPIFKTGKYGMCPYFNSIW
jgi:hypothetical protein